MESAKTAIEFYEQNKKLAKSKPIHLQGKSITLRNGILVADLYNGLMGGTRFEIEAIDPIIIGQSYHMHWDIEEGVIYGDDIPSKVRITFESVKNFGFCLQVWHGFKLVAVASGKKANHTIPLIAGTSRVKKTAPYPKPAEGKNNY